MNSRFGTKPWFHLLYLINISITSSTTQYLVKYIIKFECYILLNIVIMNARRIELVASGLIQQHIMTVVVTTKPMTSHEGCPENMLKVCGVIWLLFLIRSLHLIGVCILVKINEQTPKKHIFNRDWTTSSTFINYFTLYTLSIPIINHSNAVVFIDFTWHHLQTRFITRPKIIVFMHFVNTR